jgi:hypothetical protein
MKPTAGSYKLTPWRRGLEKLIFAQLLNKIFAFYTTRNFITVFTGHRLGTTMILVPWSIVLLYNLIVAHLAKKFSLFYETSMFLTVKFLYVFRIVPRS